eukprot:2278087-Rhodomonas_salina.1
MRSRCRSPQCSRGAGLWCTLASLATLKSPSRYPPALAPTRILRQVRYLLCIASSDKFGTCYARAMTWPVAAMRKFGTEGGEWYCRWLPGPVPYRP